MNKAIRFKLILMMVLEFFIWGAWFPLIFAYLPSLGFTPGQQTWILNAFPIAAIVGMFFSNQFADRNFAAERFLAVRARRAEYAHRLPLFLLDREASVRRSIPHL